MPGKEVPEHVGHSALCFRVGEDGLTLVVAERDVNVARVTLALVEFRHECQRLAVRVGNHLRAALIDGVVVTRDERGVVSERDFLLAKVALTLDALAVHACCVHADANVVE